jgi:hypothetical protein
MVVVLIAVLSETHAAQIAAGAPIVSHDHHGAAAFLRDMLPRGSCAYVSRPPHRPPPLGRAPSSAGARGDPVRYRPW